MSVCEVPIPPICFTPRIEVTPSVVQTKYGSTGDHPLTAASKSKFDFH